MNRNRSMLSSLNAWNKAERYLLRKKPEKAFEHFIIAFQTNPLLHTDSEETELFLTALYELSKVLESQERYKDLFHCYEEALTIFPENEEILNNLGGHLFRFNHMKEACHFFRKALNSNPYFLPARRNLESVSNLLVERWHFRMLNDHKRNEAFQNAIAKRISQGFNTVLDIGTGTGILSLFAVKAGASKVYACESSLEMIEVAADVMASNNVTDQVKLIPKMSTNLAFPADLPKKVALVVAEIFDAGVFGENLLQTLHHAWSHLLLEPDPYLKYEKPIPAEETSRHGAVIPQGFTLWVAAIECDYINSKNFHIRSEDAYFFMDLPKDLTSVVDERYDTEALRQVAGGFRLLSRPKCVLSLNLNNPRKIAGYLHGDMKIPEVKAHFIRSGRLDAFAVWFQLTLDGKTVMVSTSPEEETCWDQAIFPVPLSTEVRPGEDIALEMFCKDGQLKIEFDYPAYSSHSCECVEAPQTAVRFLNDTTHLGAMKEVASHFSRRVLSHILDFSPIPVLGIKLFKTSVVRELTCVVRSEKHKTAVREVTFSNFIVGENIQIVTSRDIDEEKQYDLIVADLIEPNGELQEKAMSQLPVLIQLLKPNVGVLLPTALTVQCVLIESDWLAEVSGVISNDRTCGFQIAEHINIYQVSQHLDFHLPAIKYTARSDSVEALSLVMMEAPDQFVHKVKTTITSSGVINAIPYWFNIRWLEGSTPISTMHTESHINQSAFIVRPCIRVIQGDVMTIVVRYYRGILSMSLETECQNR